MAMAFGKRAVLAMKILGLVLGAVTVVFGVNEATVDVYDRIGSNYWLAYSAVTSGAVIIGTTIVLSKRQRKESN